MTRVDEYFWMRDREDPKVRAYLMAENAYAAKIFRSQKHVTRGIYQELRRRVRDDDMQVPVKQGVFYYYWKTVARQPYRIFCRKRGSLSAKEQVLLDLNEIAQQIQTSCMHVEAVRVSPDHRYLAFVADYHGHEQYVVSIKDIERGKLLRDSLENVSTSLEWASDSRHLFYVRNNRVGQPKKVFCHHLGSETKSDALVFAEKTGQFFVGCNKSKSGRFLFISTASKVSSEVYFLDINDPRAKPRLIRKREGGVEYHVVHHQEKFYIRTNKDAGNFRLVSALIDHPSQWTEVIAHREDRLLEHVEEFSEYLVLLERVAGLREIRVIHIPSGARHSVSFDEPAYSVEVGQNPEFDTRLFRFTYTSFVTPKTVYDYDLNGRLRHIRKFSEVKGGFDPSNYRIERLYAPARDGVRIPISLLFRRDLRRNGRHPLYLYAYGAYGYSEPAAFAAERFTLVDRGFVFAIAHVRGGQELGRQWYESGKLLRKNNSIFDFIDCTEYLIERKYTSAGKVIASGVSAGGLLVGAVANLRPELYRAVIADVPFVDVVSSMQDPAQALTEQEYDEWGHPDDVEQYRAMLSYSPYDNVRPQAYPHMLIFGAFNDQRVPYWEPAKWAARLRDRRTNDNLVLLKTAMRAGHKGKSGRFAHLKQLAFEYTFILMTFGITPDFDEWV